MRFCSSSVVVRYEQKKIPVAIKNCETSVEDYCCSVDELQLADSVSYIGDAIHDCISNVHNSISMTMTTLLVCDSS